MEYISAPWRKEYVREVCRMKGCIFCRAARLKDDRSAYVLFRGKHTFIMLNKFPYTPGHLMIAPYRHTAALDKAPAGVMAELIKLLQLSLRVLKKHCRPSGFNAGLNLGQSAGAGVVHHYHVHVIPRWPGDSNFMPLVGKTRIFNEDLEGIYDDLLPLFRQQVRPARKRR
ncbi:MAG: HIT domain-containing protein [Acidobacteriota bacterium]